MKNIVIAIDGPVSSGKGTLSLELAKKLNILYLYTGGMYRGLTLAAIRENINLENQDQVLNALINCGLNLQITNGETKIFLHGEDVTSHIFDPSVSNKTPIVSAHPLIREEMVKRQKALIEGKSAVIEGRDIASKVAPNADLKIYLTADPKTRAQRRLEQYTDKGIVKTFDEVLSETLERDRKDSERKDSPLSIEENMVIIDTSKDSIDDTVGKVLTILKERGLYDLY